MENVQEEKIEILEKEIQELIKSFRDKKEKAQEKKKQLQFVLICVGAGTSLVLGLSFIDEIATVCKILGILFGTATSILTGYLQIYDYERKAKQYAITYLKLLELKRDLRLELKIDETTFQEYKKRLNTIMQADTNLYLQSLDEANEQEENL